MPIIINLAATMLFGAGLAAVAKSSPAFKEQFVNWVFIFLLSFVAFVITPVTTYTFRFYPQWSMLYLFDPQLFPDLDKWLNLLSAASALSNFLAGIFGYGLARSGYLSQNRTKSSLPFVIGVGMLLTVLIFQFDRIAFVGDYDAYWQGQALLMIKTAPGLLGLFTYLGAFIFILWVHSRFAGRDPEFI